MRQVNSNQRLSLRGLRTFCVAAEHGSFREAADALFTELDSVTSTYRRDSARSTLRISVQPFFASELFVPNLAEFTQLNPDIDIKVDTSDEAGEKHPGSADASIRVFKDVPKGLVSDRLFALRLVPASSAELKEKIFKNKKKPVVDFPRIVHESRANAWRQWQKESGMQLSSGATRIRLDSMIAVARAAERGLGAALVPVQLSDSWFASGALVRLFDHELRTRDAYYFVCREEDANDTAVKKFREWALQKFDDAA